MGRKELDFDSVHDGTSPDCNSADLPEPDSPTRKISRKSWQRLVSRSTSPPRPIRCSGRSALNQRASGRRNRECSVSFLTRRLTLPSDRIILSSDNSTPETISTSATVSQTHGGRLSFVAARTASRQLLKSPGRAARTPVIAVMRAATDLARSSRVGGVAGMSLSLRSDEVHEPAATQAHAASRYADRQCFSRTVSTAKGSNGMIERP